MVSKIAARFAELNKKGEPHPAKEYTALELAAIGAAVTILPLLALWMLVVNIVGVG